MDSSQSSLPVCTDDVEEDIDEDANKDHGADLEERCEVLQQILSVMTDT